MRLKKAADTEAFKDIKVTIHKSETVEKYIKQLKELQQEAKQKGLSRG